MQSDDPKQFQAARASYTYVPARLVQSTLGNAVVEVVDLRLCADVPLNWPLLSSRERASFSSSSLDLFHSDLLNGNNDEALLHGLLSVYFWGFASGADGRLRIGRAAGRTAWIVRGKAGMEPQDLRDIVRHVRNARTFLNEGRIAEALLSMMEVKHFGMSFGSKVLAFTRPTAAAVYDAVISERLRSNADPQLRTMYVDPKPTGSLRGRHKQADVYERWCWWCSSKAQELSTADFSWTDWDGSSKAWRTVDVERAFFALGRTL